jgi:hypothetical protein
MFNMTGQFPCNAEWESPAWLYHNPPSYPSFCVNHDHHIMRWLLRCKYWNTFQSENSIFYIPFPSIFKLLNLKSQLPSPVWPSPGCWETTVCPLRWFSCLIMFLLLVIVMVTVMFNLNYFCVQYSYLNLWQEIFFFHYISTYTAM